MDGFEAYNKTTENSISIPEFEVVQNARYDGQQGVFLKRTPDVLNHTFKYQSSVDVVMC